MSRGGLQAAKQPLIVYASDQSHSSVGKAALLAGFGRDNVRMVAHDDAYAMLAERLDAAIDKDKADGKQPCAVVATTGTTTTTAIDPVRAIARLARSHGLWLHVDAAMVGSAMILPECRWMWEGVEGADSLVLNAHKWLGAAFDCSVYYVRDPEHLVRVMSTNSSYLRSAADGRVKNLRDWGIPLGRRFRALKLWCLLRAEGVTALQARLRRDLENARWLAGQVRSTTSWRVLAPAPLQTVCIRHEPPGLEGDGLDEHTLGWTDRVNRSGGAYLTPAILDDRWMVRVSVGAELTERQHVEVALELDPPGGEESLRALIMRLERTYSFGRLAVRAFRSEHPRGRREPEIPSAKCLIANSTLSGLIDPRQQRQLDEDLPEEPGILQQPERERRGTVARLSLWVRRSSEDKPRGGDPRRRSPPQPGYDLPASLGTGPHRHAGVLRQPPSFPLCRWWRPRG